MSATNRGTKRSEADFYPTPINVIEHFLENYSLKEGAILEPCAGNGHFIKAIKNKGYMNEIVANEMRSEESEALIECGADRVYSYNFLDEVPDEEVATIITNPPYSHALEFVQQCKKKYPNAEIIMLLRLAFLESKKRYEFWRNNQVDELYILSQRPSFTGKGTDATAYAWFVWNGKGQQKVKVI